MTWLTKTLEVLAAILTFGASQYVSIDPCPCGASGTRLGRNRLKDWYVYCPNGCRRRGSLARTRRRAKLNWNAELKV